MTIERAVAALEAELGEDVPSLLAESGAHDLRALVAPLPAAARDRALAARPPGVALLLALRDQALRDGGDRTPDALRAPIAVTRTLIRWLGDRLGAQHPDVLAEVGMLGVLADRSGRREKARELLIQAWTGLLDAGAAARAVGVGRRLADVLLADGETRLAAEVLDACWAAARATPAAGAIGLQRADLRAQTGPAGPAADAAAEAWDAHVAHAGVTHASTPPLAYGVGRILLQAQRREEAAAVLRVAVERGRAAGWASWPESAFLLVQALESGGISEEALRTLEDALRQARGAGQRVPAAWLALAARAMAARGRGADAEGLLHEALEADRRAHGPTSLEVGARQASIGRFYLRHGRVDDALGFLEPAVASLRRLGPPAREALDAAADDLVTALVARRATARQQRDAEVAAWCDEALRGLVGSVVRPDHPALRAR